MKKILFTLLVLIFISCTFGTKETQNKRSSSKNTTLLEVKPSRFIQKLPERLDENSGIIFYDKMLWTLNDSGGKNKIYGFNLSGKIEREIEIEDAKNVDWEDIAQDKKHIYIGDFGNNNGVRNNQRIYKIKKKDIKNKESQKINSSKIELNYANQKKFLYRPKFTPFDCEAMVEFNDNLYLFTKDWQNKTTTVYRIPQKKGDYVVSPVDSFNVTGLITGADISPDKTKLALVGYKNYKPFGWLFSDISEESFFNGKKIYFEMEAIYNAQTEGVCFYGNDSLLISCEKSPAFLQQVFLIDLNTIQ